MWIDFAAAAILIIAIFRGDRRGLVRSFVGVFGWLVSIIAGFILYPDLLAILDERTGIRNAIHSKILYFAKLRLVEESGFDANSDTAGLIMEALKENAGSVYNTAAETVAAPVVDMMMKSIAIVCIMLLIRLAFGIITMLFSLIADNNGPASFLNSVGGMAFGVLEGAVIIYILILFLIFVTVIGNFGVVADQLSNSVCFSLLERAGAIPQLDTLTALMAET